MALIRLNSNRTYPRRDTAATPERSRSRWLMPAGYAGVVLLIILALIFIAQSRGSSGNAQHTMFVANGNGGMNSLVSAPSQNPDSTASSMGNAVANVAASAADQPSGSPTDATLGQGTIVHDYAADGGPGNSGAVDLGITSVTTPGSPIHATHAGMIKTLRNSANYGNIVYVVGSGYTTIYGYLQSIAVSDGQTVKRGDVIGTLGSGKSGSGVYVNYQVWQCQGDPQASGTAGRACVNKNPTDYLK